MNNYDELMALEGSSKDRAGGLSLASPFLFSFKPNSQKFIQLALISGPAIFEF